ncbi:hypothetical protein SAMN05428981_101598 [Bacillus sp. OV194]|nr:hypothetical protein SAMN05428981_101598 [Bacillus sp. OV194]
MILAGKGSISAGKSPILAGNLNFNFCRGRFSSLNPPPFIIFIKEVTFLIIKERKMPLIIRKLNAYLDGFRSIILRERILRRVLLNIWPVIEEKSLLITY